MKCYRQGDSYEIESPMKCFLEKKINTFLFFAEICEILGKQSDRKVISGLGKKINLYALYL